METTNEHHGPDLLMPVGELVRIFGEVIHHTYSETLRDPKASYGQNSSVEQIADRLKRRSFNLATGVLMLFRSGGNGRYDPAYDVVCKQAIRSATSTGANYRAVCRARSDREFFAKLSIVVEECDETVYWLAVALNTKLPVDIEKAKLLLKEAKELCLIFAKSRATMRARLKLKSSKK